MTRLCTHPLRCAPQAPGRALPPPSRLQPQLLARAVPYQQWWSVLTEAWRARRRWVLHRATLRALQHLDDRTLRDLGLAEQLPYRAPTLPTHDFQRGSW
jgi:hypothetical protein